MSERQIEDAGRPVYRLFLCEFRREIFVDDGRFLAGEETMDRAAKLGIEVSLTRCAASPAVQGGEG